MSDWCDSLFNNDTHDDTQDASFEDSFEDSFGLSFKDSFEAVGIATECLFCKYNSNICLGHVGYPPIDPLSNSGNSNKLSSAGAEKFIVPIEYKIKNKTSKRLHEDIKQLVVGVYGDDISDLFVTISALDKNDDCLLIFKSFTIVNSIEKLLDNYLQVIKDIHTHIYSDLINGEYSKKKKYPQSKKYLKKKESIIKSSTPNLSKSLNLKNSKNSMYLDSINYLLSLNQSVITNLDVSINNLLKDIKCELEPQLSSVSVIDLTEDSNNSKHVVRYKSRKPYTRKIKAPTVELNNKEPKKRKARIIREKEKKENPIKKKRKITN
jgi:hypothetical protein